MDVSDAFIDTTDVDWFSSNQEGMIAHFASGGSGYIPNEIQSSVSENESVADYVFALAAKNTFTLVPENIPSFESDSQRDQYLSSFIEMASRGFYSYDVLELSGYNKGYALIAIPDKPIKTDALPENIRSVVELAKLEMTEFKKKLYPADWVLKTGV